MMYVLRVYLGGKGLNNPYLEVGPAPNETEERFIPLAELDSGFGIFDVKNGIEAKEKFDERIRARKEKICGALLKM